MNTFSDPLKIIKQISILPDMQIADFGCGSGVYSLALAKKLVTGKVFSIDIQKDMIDRLASISKSEHLDGKIHVVWGDIDEINGSRLRNSSIDIVFLTNTLFQLEEKKVAIQEIYRVLKTGGKLIIVDWSESFGNIGPKEDHIIKEETARLLVEENGFIIEDTLKAGEHHYGFVARKI